MDYNACKVLSTVATSGAQYLSEDCRKRPEGGTRRLSPSPCLAPSAVLGTIGAQ